MANGPDAGNEPARCARSVSGASSRRVDLGGRGGLGGRDDPPEWHDRLTTILQRYSQRETGNGV